MEPAVAIVPEQPQIARATNAVPFLAIRFARDFVTFDSKPTRRMVGLLHPENCDGCACDQFFGAHVDSRNTKRVLYSREVFGFPS